MEIGVRSFFQSIDIPTIIIPLKKSDFNPYPGRIMGLEDCAESKKVAGNVHQETQSRARWQPQSLWGQIQDLPICFTLAEVVISTGLKITNGTEPKSKTRLGKQELAMS